MDRRSFLNRSGVAIGATLVLPSLTANASPEVSPLDTWAAIRSQFKLDPAKIHMSQMFLASHPKWVRDAIEKYRNALDDNPIEYWEDNWIQYDASVRKAAGAYLQCDPDEVILTDSTTMGLGILYTGFKLKEGDEILTTTHDHYSTYRALDFAIAKNKASLKRVPLFKEAASATVDEIVGNLKKNISAKTKLVAVTWVHSSTGMKLPIREMSSVIKEANGQRSSADRIYFCVDGVHGFGVENINIADLGCDFFAAGAHKWIFGPRGTGVLWGKKEAWSMVVPTIPAFSIAYAVWLGAEPESKITPSDLHSPGGFHSFEHRWALVEALEFHMKTGKDKIQERTHQLSTRLKEGLRSMKHVKLYTPVSTNLSAGINCFDIVGIKAEEVVKKLSAKNIVANSSPYRTVYARLTPSMINTDEEVNLCIDAIGGMKA